jgi:hypothetical protein
MDETHMVEVTEPDNSWKFQTLVIGGVLGALGVQLGVLLAGLLRSVLSLGE